VCRWKVLQLSENGLAKRVAVGAARVCATLEEEGDVALARVDWRAVRPLRLVVVCRVWRDNRAAPEPPWAAGLSVADDGVAEDVAEVGIRQVLGRPWSLLGRRRCEPPPRAQQQVIRA